MSTVTGQLPRRIFRFEGSHVTVFPTLCHLGSQRGLELQAISGQWGGWRLILRVLTSLDFAVLVAVAPVRMRIVCKDIAFESDVMIPRVFDANDLREFRLGNCQRNRDIVCF